MFPDARETSEHNTCLLKISKRRGFHWLSAHHLQTETRDMDLETKRASCEVPRQCDVVFHSMSQNSSAAQLTSPDPRESREPVQNFQQFRSLLLQIHTVYCTVDGVPCRALNALGLCCKRVQSQGQPIQQFTAVRWSLELQSESFTRIPSSWSTARLSAPRWRLLASAWHCSAGGFTVHSVCSSVNFRPWRLTPSEGAL